MQPLILIAFGIALAGTLHFACGVATARSRCKPAFNFVVQLLNHRRIILPPPRRAVAPRRRVGEKAGLSALAFSEGGDEGGFCAAGVRSHGAGRSDLSGIPDKYLSPFSVSLPPFLLKTPYFPRQTSHLSEVSEVSEVSANPRLMGGQLHRSFFSHLQNHFSRFLRRANRKS